jgi:hypothetical protein
MMTEFLHGGDQNSESCGVEIAARSEDLKKFGGLRKLGQNAIINHVHGP